MDGVQGGLVAVAVVTCDLGVLIGQRVDGRPLWTFPGGKVAAGEDPAGAAVRETREEAGLVVIAHGQLGRRVHPVTGRLVVYLDCRPVDDAGAFAVAPDGRELSAVRWVRPEELDGLMPQLFAPVRAFVADRLAV